MKKLTLRLNEALHAMLKQLSLQENRSLHGEIVHRLKQSIEPIKPFRIRKEFDNAE
jgi:hypothetical protein